MYFCELCVNRQLKPPNILLNKALEPKLVIGATKKAAANQRYLMLQEQLYQKAIIRWVVRRGGGGKNFS